MAGAGIRAPFPMLLYFEGDAAAFRDLYYPISFLNGQSSCIFTKSLQIFLEGGSKFALP